MNCAIWEYNSLQIVQAAIKLGHRLATKRWNQCSLQQTIQNPWCQASTKTTKLTLLSKCTSAAYEQRPPKTESTKNVIRSETHPIFDCSCDIQIIRNVHKPNVATPKKHKRQMPGVSLSHMHATTWSEPRENRPDSNPRHRKTLLRASKTS